MLSVKYLPSPDPGSVSYQGQWCQKCLHVPQTPCCWWWSPGGASGTHIQSTWEGARRCAVNAVNVKGQTNLTKNIEYYIFLSLFLNNVSHSASY